MIDYKEQIKELNKIIKKLQDDKKYLEIEVVELRNEKDVFIRKEKQYLLDIEKWRTYYV